MRLSVAILIGRLSGRLLSFLGRAGTTLPGKVSLALDPQAMRKLGSRLAGGTALISATNGKTTTAGLVEGALTRSGITVVHNSAGANMSGGIVSAMIRAPHGPGTLGLFEIDEFWLPEVASDLQPSAVLLGNLFRDQLDRYGEMDTILQRWIDCARTMASAGTKLLLCCDDPGIVWLGHQLPRDHVNWFGLEDTSQALPDLPASADSGSCRQCGQPLIYTTVLLGHLGHWHCDGCGLSRPLPDFACTGLEIDGARGLKLDIRDSAGEHRVKIQLPGVYNAYNALGAWALLTTLGVTPDIATSSLAEAGASFGRAERFRFKGHSTSIMLVKNPTGADEVLRALASEPEGLNILFVLNDRTADGRDVSWIWDANLELLAPRIRRVVCSGTRAAEASLRFQYAGVPRACIDTVEDSSAGLDSLADGSGSDIWILPTYTAMLELRGQLSDSGTLERVV